MLSELAEYLRDKGWNHKEHGRHVKLMEPCPFCGGKDKVTFVAERGTWRCVKCDESGNVLTMKRRLGDLKDVVKPLHGFYYGPKEGKAAAKPTGSRPPKALVPKCEAQLQGDADAMDYLVGQRGFSEETIAHFRLGLATKNGTRYLVIPHVQRGQVVNVKYRVLPPGEKAFARWPGCPSVLFNGDTLLDLAGKPARERVVVVCEGETDAMALHQVGFPHVVSSTAGAGSWPAEWLGLMEPATTILLAYDSDEAGELGAENAAATLGRWRCRRVTPKLHDFNDMIASGMGRQEVDQCVLQAREYGDDTIRTLSSFADEMVARLQGDRPRGRPTGWMELDVILGGLREGELTVVTGDTGCLVGETEIGFNRAGNGRRLPLCELVRRQNGGKASGKMWSPEIPTMVQSVVEPGFWGLAQAVRAVDAGVQNTVKVQFSNGSVLTGTEDHKVLTPDGEWIGLGDLSVGSEVCCKADGETVVSEKSMYRQVGGLRFHPNATHQAMEHTPYRVPYHRLVVEADMNGLDLCSFIKRLRIGGVDGFAFLDSGLVVHHKDEDVSNNELSNLEVMTGHEHKLHHADWKNFGLNRIGVCRVLSIESGGRRPTYDLTVAGTHNYIVNEIVTHNSGKSTWTTALALHQLQQGAGVLIAPFEQRPWEVMSKMVSMSSGRSVYDMETDQVENGLQKILGLPCYLLDRHGPTPLSDIRDAIYHSRHRFGVDTVVLDHLHYFLGAGVDDERKAIDQAVREIKGWTVDLGVHVLLVVHPAKLEVDPRTGQIRKPTLNDLKGASSIKQEADNGVRVWRYRDPDTLQDQGLAEIAVLKCRSPAGTEGAMWAYFESGAERYTGGAQPPRPPQRRRKPKAKAQEAPAEGQEEAAGEGQNGDDWMDAY